MKTPRPEHPNPMVVRENWMNLNGEWEFDFDFSVSARERKLYEKGSLPKKIIVPFCPESELSGIGYKDFIGGVCYRKEIYLSDEALSQRTILHFGAVDFECYVYVNGAEACHHIGGYSSFCADITTYVKSGKNEIFLIVEDDTRSKLQPCGKQSQKHNSYNCSYTRTTGIWQTVWIEFVPHDYIKSFRIYTDIENSLVTLTGTVCGKNTLSATVSYDGRVVGEGQIAANGSFVMQIKLSELHLWEIGCGRLYDLTLKFGEDTVKSYFGMRSVELDGFKVKINGKVVFLRMVLDQGYYPDGIYTAPTDDILKKDITLSLAAGFNGARLHQKIFEKRFLYHCDKAGYIVWGEHANFGMDYRSPIAAENFICEWAEAIERDFNHPSIIGWCPFTETWGYAERTEKHRIVETAYKLTKQLDPTRLCIDVSGNYHYDEVDIWDVHEYEQNVENFKDYFAHIGEGLVNDKIQRADNGITQSYSGQPVFISEYGGIKWSDKTDNAWGYGEAPQTEEEFRERYKGLTEAILNNPYVIGMCYTQLYDVEQECNGIYTYERKEKISPDFFRKINEQIAAVEK